MNNSVHLILQPQANVGKNYIGSLLSQYLDRKGSVSFVVMDKHNPVLWDKVLDEIFNPDKTPFVVVIRSHCFETFQAYLNEAEIIKTILSSEIKLTNHYVFTSGRNGDYLDKTLDFICESVETRSGVNVIWENDNMGTTFSYGTNGKYPRLSNFPVFKKIKNHISSCIYLRPESYYFQKDLSSHIRSGKTFDHEVRLSTNDLVYRQRLYHIQKKIFREIQNAGI